MLRKNNLFKVVDQTDKDQNVNFKFHTTSDLHWIIIFFVCSRRSVTQLLSKHKLSGSRVCVPRSEAGKCVIIIAELPSWFNLRCYLMLQLLKWVQSASFILSSLTQLADVRLCVCV